jgi:hypothetical protein
MESLKAFFKGKTSDYVFFVGGVVTMSLGATLVSKANAILSSTSNQTTADLSNVQTMKNIGTFFILVGLALMGWYGWILFGLYGGKEKTRELYTRAQAKYDAYKKSKAESTSTETSGSSLPP